jgi:hypothetical protein
LDGRGHSVIRRGEHNGFFWLVSTQHGLADLVEKCPKLFVGRSVVVTAFDSGPLAASRKERDVGWEQRGDIAIAPRDLDASNIPFDNTTNGICSAGTCPSSAALKSS